MIEAAFSDSACGGLKIAKYCGKGSVLRGCTSVIVLHEDGSRASGKELEDARREMEEKNRRAFENAVPLEGSPADVYGFCLSLSMGDIFEDRPSDRRRQSLERLYGFEGKEAVRDLLTATADSLEAVRKRLTDGEPMRIWYSSQPDELCGLYWLMAQLEDWDRLSAPLYLIKLPEWEIDENGSLLLRTGWGDVAPEEFGRFSSLQTPAMSELCRGLASCWRTLQKENAPLRAVVNGRLVSVSESFYDEFILRETEAEKEEFREAQVIGRILGKYRLGISDSWIALRLEEMIKAGSFQAVTQAPPDLPSYCRTLRKCGQCGETPV